MFLLDLEATPEDRLGASPGGEARSPFDFIYECAVVNKRIACRFAGTDPGPWPFSEGFAKAPEEYRNKAAAKELLQSSLEELCRSFEAMPPGRELKPVETSSGENTPLELAVFVTTHLAYHDGQLNYHQAMDGDGQIHWPEP